jgi:hypothetical protein
MKRESMKSAQVIYSRIQSQGFLYFWRWGMEFSHTLANYPKCEGKKYSRVHISLDEVFSKILKKPSIVQKKMIPHMKVVGLFNKMKQKKKKSWKRKFKMAA